MMSRWRVEGEGEGGGRREEGGERREERRMDVY